MRMHGIHKIVILLIVACMQREYVKAQYADNEFVRYTSQSGLCDNDINCIIQDAQGDLWIGTDAGLSRFDGNSFKNYFRGTAPLYLPTMSIGRLKQFDSGRLGILSRAGLLVLNTNNYNAKLYAIKDNSAMSIHYNATWDAIEMPDKSFAITSAAGFYLFDKDAHLRFRHDAFHVDDVGKKRILYGRDIIKLSASQYAVYINEDGLATYDTESKQYKELTIKDSLIFSKYKWPIAPANYWAVKQQISNHEIIFIRTSEGQIIHYNTALNKTTISKIPISVSDSINWESKLLLINDSTLLLSGSTHGFFKLKINRGTGKIEVLTHRFLPKYKIRCLFLDKEKRLWLGTTEGLLKQELQKAFIQSWHYTPSNAVKHGGGFSAMYRYRDKLYAGRFSQSKGLSIINPQTMKLEQEIDFFSTKSGWNEVRSIEMYHPDTLWIGTSKGILWLDTKTQHYGKVLDEKKYPWAYDFAASLAPARKDGYAWMCSVLGGKVLRYHIPTRLFTLFTSQTRPALPFDKVKHIVYDAYGDVWVAGHWLARFNNQLQRFDTLITTYAGEGKFNDDILVIRADNKGSLWFHNAFNGLLEYKIKQKQFVSYSIKNGLPSDLVNAMSPIMYNKLWAATNNSLYLFDIISKQVTLFDYRDGLPVHKPSSRKIYFDSVSGYLFLGYNEQLIRFPFIPEKSTLYGSDLKIEEVSAGENKIWYSPGTVIRLKHNEKNLTFRYAVVDFENSNYQFAYRLNDAATWSPLGNQRSLSFNNLMPGTYHLEIRASGSSGREKIKRISFIIHPPFWNTGWFITISVLLIAFAVHYFYKRRENAITQKAELDRQLSQTELKALQAQMNPHFIFNSLNSIREMILNNENKDASHYLSKFAHLIRITLDQSTQSFVSLRNTIDYLQRYMEMEQIRNSQFSFSISMDDQLDVDDTLIPPMLLQPFIENGLWHGITAANKKIHINIRFARDGAYLICTVDDNGIGLAASQNNRSISDKLHRSHGISNIKNRIHLLNEKHKLNCVVDIVDKSTLPGGNQQGTLVRIQLPIDIN